MMLINSYRFGAAAWSPLQLPSYVAAYDATDPTKLWQDAARTVPVVSNNDPVWTIDDITGNGHHLYAPNSTGRGLWQAGVGVLNDGVDDYYIETTGWGGTLPLYMALAYRKDADASGTSTEMFNANGNSTQILIMKSNQTGANGRQQANFRAGGVQTNVNGNLGEWLVGETHVADALHIGGTSSHQVDNETEVTTANADAANATVTGRKISVSRAGSLAALQGIFIAGMVGLADPGAQRANAKAWLAARAGITI